jgi:hypothetical protein
MASQIRCSVTASKKQLFPLITYVAESVFPSSHNHGTVKAHVIALRDGACRHFLCSIPDSVWRVSSRKARQWQGVVMLGTSCCDPAKSASLLALRPSVLAGCTAARRTPAAALPTPLSSLARGACRSGHRGGEDQPYGSPTAACRLINSLPCSTLLLSLHQYPFPARLKRRMEMDRLVHFLIPDF